MTEHSYQIHTSFLWRSYQVHSGMQVEKTYPETQIKGFSMVSENRVFESHFGTLPPRPIFSDEEHEFRNYACTRAPKHTNTPLLTPQTLLEVSLAWKKCHLSNNFKLSENPMDLDWKGRKRGRGREERRRRETKHPHAWTGFKQRMRNHSQSLERSFLY